MIRFVCATIAVLWLGSQAFGVAPALAQAPAALPDWGGIWGMQGNTVFDRASVQPPTGRAGEPGVREFPPYNEEWEARYRRNIELVRQGRFPDPVSTCGTLHGFPRIMNVPDVYEFAVTPNATYIIAENGPNVLRIYTDGRKHPSADELWPKVWPNERIHRRAARARLYAAIRRLRILGLGERLQQYAGGYLLDSEASIELRE